MNFSELLNQFTGSGQANESSQPNDQQPSNKLSNFASNIPGGLAGGAVAGGLIATLVASKSARKTAGKAAKYGGAALLGGLAYKAYKDWQHTGQPQSLEQTNSQHCEAPAHNASRFQSNYEREALSHVSGVDHDDEFELRLVKAMVASARADGQIDAEEQRRISETINKLEVNINAKSELLNLFLKPISISEIVGELDSMEQKAEIYLASCLAIELDHQAEYKHLSLLSKILNLPPGLEQQLRAQAQSTGFATVA